MFVARRHSFYFLFFKGVFFLLDSRTFYFDLSGAALWGKTDIKTRLSVFHWHLLSRVNTNKCRDGFLLLVFGCLTLS